MTPPLSKRAMRPRWSLVALLLATTAATGCKSGPYTAALHFESSAQLNPTFDGEASAVTLRLFALKDPEAFRNASDEDLMAEKPVLAATAWMEPHKEVTVYVGQLTDVPIEIWPEVRFVGVFGMFNKMSKDARRLLSVDEVNDDPTLLLDRFAITLRGEAPTGEAAPTNGATTADPTATKAGDKQTP